jgi:Tfp pilus assembly protein FimV
VALNLAAAAIYFVQAGHGIGLGGYRIDSHAMSPASAAVSGKGLIQDSSACATADAASSIAARRQMASLVS